MIPPLQEGVGGEERRINAEGAESAEGAEKRRVADEVDSIVTGGGAEQP
jgi:hypothetical protein